LSRQITRIFDESLISNTWEDGKCYQKCLCKEDGSTSKFCNTLGKDAEAKFRYCPNDPYGCACQLQCFSSNMDASKNEAKLVGIEQLKLWDIDFRDVLIKSYHTYRNADLSLEGSGEIFYKSYKTKDQLLELPTCASPQVDMGDFKKDGRHNRLFPCTCGDWRSNETQIFMNQLGFGISQPGFKSDTAKELLTRDCPGVRISPPVKINPPHRN